MRILAVNWLERENPRAGGAEQHFFEIFGRLVQAGMKVTLIASGWPGAVPRAEIDGIQVRRIAGRHSFALFGRGAVRRALQEERYDLVVEDINKLPLYLPTLTHLPVYAIVPHLFGATAFGQASWPVATVVWLSERAIPRVYRRAAFHAISGSTRDDLVARGIPRDAIRVIPPGIDTSWFHPDPTIRRFADPIFLYLGRLKRYKGIATAIQAVAMARERGHQVRLEIVGQGDDRPRLETTVRELDLGGAISFRGFVSEVEKRDLLRRAWALVFPSAKEGWGIANMEAAACGTPVIASDSPGLRDSVVEGQTGFLVPHGDPAALCSAMLRLAAEPAVGERLGQAGRRFAETLSWERAATDTERHLQETVAANRR
ncbi:MAG: glycosyltransferase family 4 protein [Gemmatimonadetes bacterium]|nr:glycosyltransferase family 4 protein [Gemmatimonadota bacterium]